MESVGSVVAVLTAAGSGTRLGGNGPKALVELGGVPLVLHAARSLAAAGVDAVVVTSPAGYVDRLRGLLDGLGPRCLVVDGGPSRQASVAAALAACPQDDDGLVLVHDAARPLASPALVGRVLAALRAGHDAVVPGLPVADTVKEVLPGGGRGTGDGTSPVDAERVRGTVDRTVLRAVQTPQGFRRHVLDRAHRDGADRAADESTAASDDAALVEAIGVAVWVVPGEDEAMKVTTAGDLGVAEMLLAARDGEAGP